MTVPGFKPDPMEPIAGRGDDAPARNGATASETRAPAASDPVAPAVTPPYPTPSGALARLIDSQLVMRILLVEDDQAAAAYISKALSESGHVVDHAATGRDGLYLATSGDYDAVVLDRMLPGLDGLSVLQAMRAADVETPVLILSALDKVDDRVKGLKAGGDDYLTKPFAFSELQARLEALGRRRKASTAETVLKVADLEMDLLKRLVKRAGREIDLQPREFKLLECLMRHADQVVTRTMLLESVWDYHFDPQTNVIDVHVSRLRQKIDKGFDRPLLHTVRGAGYSLRAAS
jgi:two-component system OmpR family response regulator